MNKTLDSDEEEKEEKSRFANKINDSTNPNIIEG